MALNRALRRRHMSSMNPEPVRDTRSSVPVEKTKNRCELQVNYASGAQWHRMTLMSSNVLLQSICFGRIFIESLRANNRQRVFDIREEYDVKIFGRAPTPSALRREVNLPPSSIFLGWAVNAEQDDSYLQDVRDGVASTLRTFCAEPKRAKLFDKHKDAGAIVIDLAYPAYIVAIFEIDNAYAVIPVGGNELSRFGPRSN